MLRHEKEKVHLRMKIDILILKHKNGPHYFIEKCAYILLLNLVCSTLCISKHTHIWYYFIALKMYIYIGFYIAVSLVS